MYQALRADRERYRRRKSRRKRDFVWLRTGMIPLVTYRLGRWMRIHRSSWFRFPLRLVLMPPFLILKHYTRLVYDIDLDESSEIAPGLYIGHFGGIRVQHCKMGERCSIHQEVRLVPSEPGAAGPEIGNRVWIGAHARVLGPVHVGDGATIGSGAVVSCDVEAGCLVLGNPARVVRRNYDNSHML